MGISFFKEDREDRLRFYGKRVYGIKAYINFWVPFIAVISIWGVIQYITDWDGSGFIYGMEYVIQVLTAAMALLAFIAGRFFNKYTFYVNIVFLSVFVVSRVYIIISLLISTQQFISSMSQAVQETSNAYPSSITNALGSAVYAGASIGGQIVLISEFIAFGLILIFCIFYFHLFIKNRKLFVLSYQDLRDNYDDFIG